MPLKTRRETKDTLSDGSRATAGDADNADAPAPRRSRNSGNGVAKHHTRNNLVERGGRGKRHAFSVEYRPLPPMATFGMSPS